MTARYEPRVPMTQESHLVHEIHFHLGDILPPGMNYQADEEVNVSLKVTLHYSDPWGREKTKTITLPSTTIL